MNSALPFTRSQSHRFHTTGALSAPFAMLKKFFELACDWQLMKPLSEVDVTDWMAITQYLFPSSFLR
jgi:hypothetical protein